MVISLRMYRSGDFEDGGSECCCHWWGNKTWRRKALDTLIFMDRSNCRSHFRHWSKWSITAHLHSDYVYIYYWCQIWEGKGLEWYVMGEARWYAYHLFDSVHNRQTWQCKRNNEKGWQSLVLFFQPNPYPKFEYLVGCRHGRVSPRKSRFLGRTGLKMHLRRLWWDVWDKKFPFAY